MSAHAELQDVRRAIRRRSWKLKSVLIRQAARRAFDLPKFGTGPLERITVSLILAVVFGFATLFASHHRPVTADRFALYHLAA